MPTGFDLFRKSTLLSAHEHVANSYIDAEDCKVCKDHLRYR